MTPAFERDGAVLAAGAARPILAHLADLTAALPVVPGLRLRDLPALSDLLAAGGALHALATALLGPRAMPVRAILFDKSPGANWSLGWHQDRTICVEKRREVAGFGPWTVKRGLLHVEPPFAVIEAMVTMRVHLDAVDAANAPLLIAPGSHRLGRIAEADYDAVVAGCGTMACLAQPGDVWLYAAPILHASAASRSSGHRRVLQLDYAATHLPGGLIWRGI